MQQLPPILSFIAMKPFCLLLLYLPFVYLQNAQGPIETTAALFRRGDIQELSKHMASSIEITLDDDEATYPKAKAMALLEDFFRRNVPVGVRVMHRINSSPKFHFGVFMLATQNGTFRVAESFKNNNGHFILSELRIEPEKTK